MPEFKIADRIVGDRHPTYFIADIAANHDGDLTRAKDLISKAKEAGAEAAKFQHFRARHIVSDYGFKDMKAKVSHQSSWTKSIFEVYEDASIDWEWTEELAAHCKRESIHFFSSPYDLKAVDHLSSIVPAFKIGSGDISWLQIVEYIAKKGQPVLIASGASDVAEVARAVTITQKHNRSICLFQCNTNYTGSRDNFRYLSLNVLKSYAAMFPDVVLGLSDHTPGDVSVLGAVALGARVIEKHFTDDNDREGPDHPFSMNPTSWREMVERTRDLEASLGNTLKIVEENERDTRIVQRRCVRAAQGLAAGTVLSAEHLECLRPAPEEALQPAALDWLIGRRLTRDMPFGKHFTGREV
ncbi:MAG: N-acetylneuraminate synthase family protein, partial [Cytophagales bacterium]|nr:N-acetylneuraminate synthase family protein [Cytophagales bacterium]